METIMETWLMIQSGIVVNSVYASDMDVKDPAYIWVNVTNYNPIPAIGWTTTDNISFTNPNEALNG
jgi:hypothetical protein